MPELLTAPKGVRTCHCDTHHGLAPDDFRVVTGRLHAFLMDVARRGETVAAWGSSDEACAFLCAGSIGPEQIGFTIALGFPASGRRLPCSGIPVYAPGHLRAVQPDWLIALPGTSPRDVASRARLIREWGGQVVVPGPNLEVVQ